MIPNQIKIGWKTYVVLVKPTALNSGEELFGQIDYAASTITLREGNTQAQSECTLIHEMLHGISDMYGLDLEEKTVTVLANALYAVIKDNPREKDRGGAPMKKSVEPAKHCGNCKRKGDDVSACKLLNCHRAYGQKELENKDFVTDAWEKAK